MATEKTTTFGIRVKTETDAAKTASSVDALRDSILASQDAVKQYGSSLRLLKGDTDEIKSARDKLKGALDAERASISANALALGKMGTNLAAEQSKVLAAKKAEEGLAKARQEATKKAEEGLKKQAEALAKWKAQGGSNAFDAIRIKTQKFFAELSTGNGQLAAFQKIGSVAFNAVGSAVSTMASLAVASFAAIGVAIAAFTGGMVAAGVALAKFSLENANALRDQQLMREGVDASAVSATHLGHQIEVLADKVPQTRSELNAMAVEIRQSFDRTRISGDGIVDVFNAIAQESAGAGQSAGRQLQGLIERGKVFGRLQLNPFELQGTGITFADIAKNLASEMKISIDDARGLLLVGRVKLDAGAKAIRKTVEDRFAELNIRKSFSLEVIAAKFKDTLQHLTSDIKLEPILRAFKSLTQIFDDSTTSGKVFKTLLTDFANTLGDLFVRAVPYVKFGVLSILSTVLDLQIKWELAKNQFKTLFPDTSKLIADFDGVRFAIDLFVDSVKGAIKFTGDLFTGGMFSAGSNVVGGLTDGITKGGPAAVSAIGLLADKIKTRFEKEMLIQSPSKVSAGWGKNIGLGLSDGIDGEAARVQASVNGLVPTSPSASVSGLGGGGSSGGSVGGGAPITVQVKAEFPNAKNGQEVVEALTGASFRTRLIESLEREIRARGLPTQAKGAL